MLLMPDKKKVASVIVSRIKPPYVQREDSQDFVEKESVPSREDAGIKEAGIGLIACSEKCMDALKNNDAEAFSDYLKDFMSMVMDEESTKELKEPEKAGEDKHWVQR